MKFSRLACLVTFAGGCALAASAYNVKLYDDVRIAGSELKAGDYKVEMEGNKAKFVNGKDVVEVPATLQKADHKYPYTALIIDNHNVNEIDLGGTESKIVFAPAAA